MTTPQDIPLPGQMDPSIQTTRGKAALKWNDYLLTDLNPSDEGWEMSMVLKQLAEKYEAYDETPHSFGDGYNIRWKRYFALVFQMLFQTLPQGTVALEQAIEMLERPEAPEQVGPAIIRTASDVEHANTNAANANADTNAANINSAADTNSADMIKVNNAGNVNTTANKTTTTTTNNKKRPAEAMDQNDDNNNHDSLHPSKRIMTTHQNYPALPPGTVFKVDTQSAYRVRITEGPTPTFKFKSSGPVRVHVRLNHGGDAAGGAGSVAGNIDAPVADAATASVAACVVPNPAATPDVANPLGTTATKAPAPDPPAAPGALVIGDNGTIAVRGTVVPAAHDPAPAVVSFATRASLAALGDVGNTQPTATGWEGMGWEFEGMGFEELSSISSMSSNTETDSDIA